MILSSLSSLLVSEDLPTLGLPVKQIRIRPHFLLSSVESFASGMGPKSSLILFIRTSALRPCSAETMTVFLKPRRWKSLAKSICLWESSLLITSMVSLPYLRNCLAIISS